MIVSIGYYFAISKVIYICLRKILTCNLQFSLIYSIFHKYYEALQVQDVSRESHVFLRTRWRRSLSC